MDEKTYALMSNSLLNFGKDVDGDLRNYITDETLQNLRIYQKNYFSLFFGLLSEKYMASYKFIEVDNFNYLVREFVMKESMVEASIEKSCMNFQAYIESSISVHGDQVLILLSKLDYFWSFNRDDALLNLPKGVLDLWLKLVDKNIEVEEVSFDIDLDTMEEIKLKCTDLEKTIVREKHRLRTFSWKSTT